MIHMTNSLNYYYYLLLLLLLLMTKSLLFCDQTTISLMGCILRLARVNWTNKM